MLDDDRTRLKLIDLDKLSWSGDYLADLGVLAQVDDVMAVVTAALAEVLAKRRRAPTRRRD